jgi:ABC-type transport system substrate-binding protein
LVAPLTLSMPRRGPVLVTLGTVLALAAALGLGGPTDLARAAARDDVRILAQAPSTFDPAAQADAATAAVLAQVYESVTAFDASRTLRPALAQSWDVSADGRQVTFHLRPNLAFSDGSPISAADVVGSWLRVIDPASPSPLSSLFLDVTGAAAYLAGSGDPSSVGLHASGSDVIVDLDHGGADFPAIVASPTFGIVPPSVWRDRQAPRGPGDVVSGGYVVSSASAGELTLTANPHYWAGPPAISTVHLVLDIGGRSPVAAFEAGDLDYTEIAANDASWIMYDPTLGPQLREIPELSLTYLGFDTSEPPFNDVRVRQAIGAAVDWNRVVSLGLFGSEIQATSMVPPGIPGTGDANWLPAHDPAQARQLLAAAGYPGGAGLPTIEFATDGATLSSGIVADIRSELGISVQQEVLSDHFTRLATDPPAMWLLGWIADYPGPNDFLGVLLGSGSSSNYSRWSSPEFDQAVASALSTRDPTASQAAWEQALGVVQRDVPTVPLTDETSWALSRQGLLGAGQNGMGLLRMAGLAWQP